MEKYRPPLHIYKNIEKVSIDRLDLLIDHTVKGYKIVGIHHKFIHDVVEELPVIIKALEKYHQKMVKFYSRENQK